MWKMIVCCCFGLLMPAVPAGTAADFVRHYPARWTILKQAVDEHAPGLEKFRAATTDGEAAAALLAHLRTSPANRRFLLATLPPGNMSIKNIANHTYTIQGKRGTFPKRPDGHVDWNFIPQEPEKLDMQFPSLVSRAGSTLTLLHGYAQYRRDPAIAALLRDALTDFILGQPYRIKRPSEPNRLNNFGNMRSTELAARENIVWQTLNAAIRLQNWVPAFFVAGQLEMLDAETMLLWLSSLEEHADYQYVHGFSDGNWGTTEMSALLRFAAAFPEFRRAKLFARTAAERYQNNLRESIYPDGAQFELAHGYGYLVFRESLNFAAELPLAGLPVPETLRAMQQKQMYFYLKMRKPDGQLWAHGDTDSEFFASPEIRQQLQAYQQQLSIDAAQLADQSEFFAWSGTALMRTEKIWAVLDIGPFGIGHNHPDKLALNLFAGRELLTDPGRYAYNWQGGWTPQYFQATAGHNTVSIDQCDQAIPHWRDNVDRNAAGLDLVARQPITDPLNVITPAFDRFHGRTVSGYRQPGYGPPLPGKAIHDRTVHFDKKSGFFLVLDRIFTDRPRRIDAFWHFGPEIQQVQSDPDHAVRSADANAENLLILPLAGGAMLHPKLFRGAEKPIRGWYATGMNRKIPTFDAVYSGQIAGDAHFGWLLLPFAGAKRPEAAARLVHIGDQTATVEVKIGDATQRIDLPLAPAN